MVSLHFTDFSLINYISYCISGKYSPCDVEYRFSFGVDIAKNMLHQNCVSIFSKYYYSAFSIEVLLRPSWQRGSWALFWAINHTGFKPNLLFLEVEYFFHCERTTLLPRYVLESALAIAFSTYTFSSYIPNFTRFILFL